MEKKNWVLVDGILMTPEDADEYHRLRNEAEYHDSLQYIFKIKLNSYYGAKSNKNFRFFSWNGASSTTGTGRLVLQHQCRKANELLTGEYHIDFPMYAHVEDMLKLGYTLDEANKLALDGDYFRGEFQSKYVIYGDTDSSYVKSDKTSMDEVIEQADYVAKAVNDSFPEFMRKTFLCRPGFDDKIQTAREHVIDRGIWVDKKRYIVHVVNTEGKSVDKMKIMGIDTKKTTLPPHVSDKINHLIEDFLKGKSWEDVSNEVVAYKDELRNSTDIRVIGLPKGVSGIDEYMSKMRSLGEATTVPGHVRASIFYNKMREKYDDVVSPEITSGMKIKVFYFKRPIGKNKSIALPTDIDEVPSWLTENFEIDVDAHIQRLVDNPIENIVKAIGKKAPNRQDMYVDSLFEF